MSEPKLLSADELELTKQRLWRTFGKLTDGPYVQPWDAEADFGRLVAHIASLTRELEEAREALEPFIRVHSVGFSERGYADTDAIYGRIVTTEPDKNCSLTAGDLRRAIALHTRLSSATASQETDASAVAGEGEVD